MPRPSRCRKICCLPEYLSFSPDDDEKTGEIVLTLDEFEALRLIDYEKMTQAQCAGLMEVSRATVAGIYESARYKVADCLVNGKRILFSGGNYRFGMESTATLKVLGPGKRKTGKTGGNYMRVAVTYDNGEIFQHFGHTEQFKLFDIEDGEIKASEVIGTNGAGHGALAGFLGTANVDALICGGIGGGAKVALSDAGIKLYAGVSGSADEAAKALARGELDFDPNAHCDHHDHEHGGGSCGEHSCGH